LRNRSYVGEFKATRIFNSYLTFDLKAYYTLKDINVFKNDPNGTATKWNRVRDGEYRDVREGVSLSFGSQLERLGQVTVEGRSEHQRIWSIFNQPVASQSFHVSSIKVSTKVDSRDRFPYPREGTTLEFSYESGVVRAADRLGFTKMVFNYTSFKTFSGRQTISPRIQFGFGDETVPITEMFTLGGVESFFGFREDDARGRQLFALSLEYRYFLPIRILFDTYFKVRYDVGHIWEKAEQIRLKDMRHGIGVGLGLDSPIGPVEFSVGRAFFIRKDLFDNPVSFGPFVAYFRVGYAF
jgi:NTE family protein